MINIHFLTFASLMILSAIFGGWIMSEIFVNQLDAYVTGYNANN